MMATLTAAKRGPAGALKAVRAPQVDIAPQHWQGGALNCADCEYRSLRDLPEQEGCEPGYACMQDVYARRIDRFFRWHPTECDVQLGHPYFEVRAIAARFANVFRLTSLMDDPDETVRLQVALRVPTTQLHKLIDDPHREVRLRVAMRLGPQALVALRNDSDYGVRELVAQRLPLTLLPTMAQDSDRAVRMRVAQRLEMPALLRMAEDQEPEVRRLVARRLPVALLGRLLADADWGVRFEVAQRADRATLLRLQEDSEADIRQLVQDRLAALASLAALTSPPGAPHG